MNKFCRDCRWVKPKYIFNYKDAVCMAPSVVTQKTDLVEGVISTRGGSCFTQRLNNVGACKEIGLLWEAKEPHHVP